MATDSMAAKSCGEEESAQRHGPELGRVERHGQDGGQHECHTDHRLPTPAIEGDTHDRHEQQQTGSAPDPPDASMRSATDDM